MSVPAPAVSEGVTAGAGIRKRRRELAMGRSTRAAIGALTAFGLWWMVVTGFDIRPLFLPGPDDVAMAIFARAPHLLAEAGVTLAQMAAGFGISVLLGLGVALMLAAFDWLRDATLPIVVAIPAVPKVALAPLMVVWFGYGHVAKIAMAALMCYFPVVIAAHQGLRATPTELVDLGESLSASRWQTFRKLRIPWAMPQIFVGLKLALTMALIGTVVAQISTPNSGLGSVIVTAMPYGNTPLAFAAIVLLAAIGVGGFYLLVGLEKLALPWARAIAR